MLSPRKPWISPEEYLEIDRASDVKYEYHAVTKSSYRSFTMTSFVSGKKTPSQS